MLSKFNLTIKFDINKILNYQEKNLKVIGIELEFLE